MNKKLIIFMPSIEGGGVEKNLFIISNFLSKKIQKVYLITASKRYKNKFNKKVKLIIPYFKFWDLLGRRIKYFVCLKILFFEIIKNKNIIVFSFQANIYAIILCKLFSVKIITRSNTAPDAWNKNFFKKKIFSFFIKKADAIIVNSKDFKSKIDKLFKVKSICIYNPLNAKEVLTKSKKKIHKPFREKQNLKIINIGRMVDQKDQITLLKAAKLLKNKLNFEIIIMGRGILKKKLQNFISANELNNIVRLIDFKQNPYPYIVNSDLFILTSKFEGLPNVLLEAIVLKKFVISTNCPTGPKEILDNGKGGMLFKVGDYYNLSKKILYFYNNQKKNFKKRQHSTKRLYRFNYNRCLASYFNTILSIANKN